MTELTILIQVLSTQLTPYLHSLKLWITKHYKTLH